MSTLNKIRIILILSVISISSAYTQSNSTTSPYSRYGYGVLSDKGVGLSRGMGGISYGLRGLNANPGNPASYSGVDSLTFIFDLGISYSNARLSDSGGSQNDNNGGLDYLTILFPISKRLGVSAGFLPYSSVGYSFGSVQEIDGAAYQKYFSGSGGLSQVYGGIAYEPFNGISIGANVSYLYGTITHNRNIPVISENAYTRSEYRKLRVNAAKFDFGLQYQFPAFKGKTLTLGAVYSPKISPNARIKGIDMMASGDTISILPSTKADAELPQSFGFGFTLKTNKLLFGADVTFQNWKKLNYSDRMADSMTVDNRFNDRWRFNAGVEYVINPNSRNFFHRMKFRGGVNYSNSYINVHNSQNNNTDGYNEYGATVGFGLPFRDTYTNRTSYVNISFEYTNLSPKYKNGMIKEQYFGVSIGVNINDLWFMKNKFK
ncbi:MAG: OmpP1/FadL family transporter [Dysgonomonas sp.]